MPAIRTNRNSCSIFANGFRPIRMEIRQLKYFLQVAETLNFSKASRKLYVTQSTLSQQISHLEQEIGMPLFERNSHEVYLTEAGKNCCPTPKDGQCGRGLCGPHERPARDAGWRTQHRSDILLQQHHGRDAHRVHPCLPPRQAQHRLSFHAGTDGRTEKRELDLVLAFKPLKRDKVIDSRAILAIVWQPSSMITTRWQGSRASPSLTLNAMISFCPTRACRRATPSSTCWRGVTTTSNHGGGQQCQYHL